MPRSVYFTVSHLVFRLRTGWEQGPPTSPQRQPLCWEVIRSVGNVRRWAPRLYTPYDGSKQCDDVTVLSPWLSSTLHDVVYQSKWFPWQCLARLLISFRRVIHQAGSDNTTRTTWRIGASTDPIDWHGQSLAATSSLSSVILSKHMESKLHVYSWY